MDRDRTLYILRSHMPQMQARYGVTRLGVFGSIARDAAAETSDIDIIVDMPPDAFQMVHLKEELEALLRTQVDLIRYHKHLNPLLRSRIDRDAIFI